MAYHRTPTRFPVTRYMALLLSAAILAAPANWAAAGSNPIARPAGTGLPEVSLTQSAPPAAPRGEPAPRPGLPRLSSPKDADPRAMPIPESRSERQKLLDNLYAYLATAGSKQEAEPIAATIERLWLLKGTDTSFYLMERARQAIQEQNLAKAIRFLDQVVELAPDYAEGWLRRAYVHMLDSDKERALGDLRRALALEPQHFQALKATAMIFLDNGQHAAALKALEKLIEVHPNEDDAVKLIEDLKQKVDGQKT